MKQWLPENAARKALTRPQEIPKFLANRSRDAMSSIHTGLAVANLPLQQDNLADLRRSENFCLVILDACRYDILKQEFDTYFKGSIMPTKTPARSTFEYLQYNWSGTYEYPYVTAAPPATSEYFDFDGRDEGAGLPQESEALYKHYRGYVPANHLENLEEVWRDSWDEELRTCPPEPVTRRAVELAGDTEKMVVHYFQPHAPFIGEHRPEFADGSGSNITDEDFMIDSKVWPAVKDGDVSKDELQRFYTSNLQRVLAAVSHLISETAFEQYVIIGDHGEALGEYSIYQHGKTHPYVNTVPWALVDEISVDVPEMWEYSSTEESDSSTQTEDRLRNLGYL
jgi:hypothetical protein